MNKDDLINDLLIEVPIEKWLKLFQADDELDEIVRKLFNRIFDLLYELDISKLNKIRDSIYRRYR